MKKFITHLFFLITATLLCNYTYASPAVDSLPACILKMKQKDSLLIVDKYDYKGQQWFSMRRMLNLKESQMSDRMNHLEFYNEDCKIVCTWTKGGIAGLNKVTPDTIEKAKIKKIEILLKDSIKKYPVNSNALPGTIVKMALAKNVQEIVEYLYQDKILYEFRYPLYYKQELPKKGSVTIDDPYYDKNGKVILIYKRAIQGTFTRAERWEPASVKRSDVTELPNGIWFREKNNFKKLSTAADNEKAGIPACILKLKNVQDPIFLTEYNYKGQSWYAFSRNGSSPVSDVSDERTYTTFYNTDCKIVCFWTKDGTTGLNKATPDTIEKEKIKKVRIVPAEINQKLPSDTVKKNSASAAQINNPVTDVPAVDFQQGNATFGYSARITPDGILRYKTPAKPVAAAIIFQDPVTGVYPKVDFNPKKERRTYAVKEEKAGEYIIDISKENYNEKPALTLILTTAKGDSAAVILGNRNVKARNVQFDKSNYGHHMQKENAREFLSTVKQWNDAKEHYYVRTVTGNAAQPGGPQTYIFIVNDKGNTLRGGGIGSSIKLPEGGFLRLFGLTDTLLSQLDNCKNCPSARKPAEMDSIAKAAQKFVRTGINYHLPVAGQPAYYLYAKDEYGIMHLIDGKFARGCSFIERDIKAVGDFLDVWDRYEKNGAAVTKALEEGSLIINSADKDFIPRATMAVENTLACTIWIDNAGLVHCKTTNPLFSSDIYFHSPAATVTENGITRTVQPEESEKHYVPKKISANEYVMDISKEKYKQMDKITVIVEDRNGKNAMVYLFNKRMQRSK
ncbi:MAG: hypothetical protein H0W75_05950 [Chitinophagaceae bacterium]|nr:hypothetical protein [Chitinophagaceae bacterium]